MVQRIGLGRLDTLFPSKRRGVAGLSDLSRSASATQWFSVVVSGKSEKAVCGWIVCWYSLKWTESALRQRGSSDAIPEVAVQLPHCRLHGS